MLIPQILRKAVLKQPFFLEFHLLSGKLFSAFGVTR